MSDVVIKVENLSKQYRLGVVGTGTLSHDLNRVWARIRGKDDPYLFVGDVNDRTKKGDSDLVWALRNINFEVKSGEVVGIVGRNGAGKSTLLKILSQVTTPSLGSIRMKGRIGSLLEVGTGFHPELTGRENLFLNGAILGMRKWEINKKLDDIIDFAGVEKYIDTPVKRYSSGMKVRLAFSIAAHLDPEILIVDEVLAVGDAEFQKKCLGKMGDVSKNEGRTILFVSHNMHAVQSLCSRSMLIENGSLAFEGSSESVIREYTSRGGAPDKVVWSTEASPSSDGVSVNSVQVESEEFDIEEISRLTIKFELEDESLINFSVHVFTDMDIHVFNVGSGHRIFEKGDNYAVLEFPKQFFNNLKYKMRIMIYRNRKKIIDLEDVVSFEMKEYRREGSWFGKWQGVIRPNLTWNCSDSGIGVER